MDKLLYGAAYYDEYMPYERLERDMEMMTAAGINVIRIAESTWSSEETADGVFDFTHVRRALEAAQRHGISVIVGTPTYAIPPWLAAAHPEIIAVTERGQGKYGGRQNMDITSPAYLYYAERVIRRLLECVQQYDNVIGFQLDNETKHYHTAGPNVQRRFISYLRDKFGTTDKMNEVFGFNYWSNRVNAWEDVPDVTGTINGSFGAEFEKFRRSLVEEFLSWQANIVREYLRDGQFVTHNLDFSWDGASHGIQPDVNHNGVARLLTVAGCDIYHRTQDHLTGAEAAFFGSLVRSLKNDNYLVLETGAQGHANWTPYDGQLRLHAISHISSGANAVMYWHWHSIHNACETYWKGILSHDLRENRVYREVASIGADLKRLSPKLVNLKKNCRVAILVSNESLTGLEWFRMPGRYGYNDIVRSFADALYRMNVEYDVIFPDAAFDKYSMLIVPALYSADDDTLLRLDAFAHNGGVLIAGFRSGFSDEYLKVRSDVQPGLLSRCCGVEYDEFTAPDGCRIKGGFADGLPEHERDISCWMELITPTTARTISYYDHKFWGRFSAVTENEYGSGHAYYVGCHVSGAYTKRLLSAAIEKAGICGVEQRAEAPVIIKSAVNDAGRSVRFYMNFSGDEITQEYLHADGVEIFTGAEVKSGAPITIVPWGFAVIEETE